MIKRNILLILSATFLILFAVFIYINNDLDPNRIGITANRSNDRTEESLPPATDTSGRETEAALDGYFEAEEAADNFDDIIE